MSPPGGPQPKSKDRQHRLCLKAQRNSGEIGATRGTKASHYRRQVCPQYFWRRCLGHKRQEVSAIILFAVPELRAIGSLSSVDQSWSRSEIRDRSVPFHTRPRTCQKRVRHSRHRNGRIPVKLIARSRKLQRREGRQLELSQSGQLSIPATYRLEKRRSREQTEWPPISTTFRTVDELAI
jgi:hypothetical protein